jgi:hypothetical protein
VFSDSQEVKRNPKEMRFPDISFSGMYVGEKYRSASKHRMEMTTVCDYLKGDISIKKQKERTTSQTGFNSRNSRNTSEGKNPNKRALQIKVKKEGQNSASPSLTPENQKHEQGSLREVIKNNI